MTLELVTIQVTVKTCYCFQSWFLSLTGLITGEKHVHATKLGNSAISAQSSTHS